jgi:4-amino-4-deoxy-L-arabinose transferase-like glycosyltransferase
VAAFLLRFIGTNPGYNQYHPDEGISYSAAVSMIKDGNLDPLRYDYPSVVPLTNYIFFKYLFVPIGWGKYYLTHLGDIFVGLVHIPIVKLEAQRILQVFIFGNREINALFWGRYITALFSLGSVLAVYFLAKKLFSKNIGLLAAFFLAVNFRAVLNSHIGLPDTYNAFFLLLSLIFSYRIVEKPSVKNYLLSGIFLGLSFSTKYQIFAVFPFLTSHIYSSLYNKKNLFSRKIVLAGLTTIAVFILLNPYFWLHIENAVDILSYVSKKYAMGKMKLMTYPFYYFYHIDYGPLLSISVVIGLFYSLKKFCRQSLFLLAELIPFFFIMIYFSGGGFYVRNFITITPILMIFAAVFIGSFLGVIKNKSFLKYLSPLIIFGVVFITLKNSVISSYYYTKQWTYDEILNQSSKILPKGSLVASHPFDPLPDYVVRTEFERSVSYSLAEFREEKADYALVNMDWASDDFYGWMLKVFPDSLQYWQKPISIMQNTFSGAAMEEMMDYVMADAFKPWQAPDAALFLIKIPYFQDVKYKQLSTIELNQEFSVKPGFVYRVSGLISSDEFVVKNKRSAYIRIDFYSKAVDGKEVRVGSSVSARYYGSGRQNLELLAVAPGNSVSAKIILGVYLDDLESYSLTRLAMQVSKEKYTLGENYLKLNFKQYQDLLYPYSDGNL